MDSYLIGCLLIETFFWATLSSQSYFEMIPVRAMIYGLSLLLFYPVAARFARERKGRAQNVPAAEGVRSPADALAVHLPENITVYYRPAPLVRRLHALAVDGVLIAALSGMWWFAMAIAAGVFRVHALAGVGFELGLLLVPLTYFLWQEANNDGQTMGKKQAGIRAIHESGRALTFSEVFARNILRPLLLLPPFNLIEAFSMRTNGWRQRLGDLAAGSVVIIDPK